MFGMIGRLVLVTLVGPKKIATSHVMNHRPTVLVGVSEIAQAMEIVRTRNANAIEDGKESIVPFQSNLVPTTVVGMENATTVYVTVQRNGRALIAANQQRFALTTSNVQMVLATSLVIALVMKAGQEMIAR